MLSQASPTPAKNKNNKKKVQMAYAVHSSTYSTQGKNLVTIFSGIVFGGDH